MSRFRRHRHEVPGLNLAAMPDLIFTVLFFFMIVTHMRQVTPRVRYDLPQSATLSATSRQAGQVFILIGRPVDAQGRITADEVRVQLNDRYVSISDIPKEIQRERERLSASKGSSQLSVTIRADRDTPMGVISDVKQALRQGGALNVNYSAKNKSKENKTK